MNHQQSLIAVFVGTDHHPFDRLMGWISELAATGKHQWYVQHGATRLPSGINGSPMLGSDELHHLLSRANAVVTHAGPGLIMDARSLGHQPIVVARDPALGEHIDDHQQRFLEFVSRREMVVPANSKAALSAAVEAAVAVDKRYSPAAAAGEAASARFGSLVDDLLRRS